MSLLCNNDGEIRDDDRLDVVSGRTPSGLLCTFGSQGSLRGGTHVPLGFQAVIELMSGTDDIFWYATNAICSRANTVQLLSRHRTAVATYTACIRGGIASLESGWRCEVKGGKSA